MKSTAFTVNSTAVKIADRRNFFRVVNVHCASGSCHLGGSDVTTSNGLPLANGENREIHIPVNETLYAVDGTGSAAVVVLDSSAE